MRAPLFVAATTAAGGRDVRCGRCGGRGARGRGGGVREALRWWRGEEEEGRGPGPGGGGRRRGAARRRQPHAGLFVLETVEEAADEERSSIGAASEDEEEEGDEADSGGAAARRNGAGGGALSCMDALDDALPIKRGLSNFFSGKSRSFANLQDAASAVSSARDLAKPENPFNKRRRVLRCCSIRRVASTSLTALPPFLPPTTTTGGTDGAGAGSEG